MSQTPFFLALPLVLSFATGCAARLHDQPQQSFQQQQPQQQGMTTLGQMGSMNAPQPGSNAPPPFEMGQASFYSDHLAGRATATGEAYDPDALTAAHRTLPLGSIVDVVRRDGRAVRVRINDRGPYVDGRVIDLSKKAAASLGMLHDGVDDVAIWVVFAPPPRHHEQPREPEQKRTGNVVREKWDRFWADATEPR
jgi:rare lipoprotein A